MLRMRYSDHFLSVRSLLFSNDFFSEAAEPILLKFHMEPPKVGQTKECLNGSGPLTLMAAMSIYGKKNFKIFSRTEDTLELYLFTNHRGRKVYQVAKIKVVH